MTHDSDSEGSAARPRVAALRNLRGYKVAEGDPDVRGWEVAGGDGLRIGIVNDLLVDTVAGKARYLDIELDPSLYLEGTPTGIEARDERRLEAETAPELDPLAGPDGVIGQAVVPAAEIDPNLGASTTTEYVVRATLSDTENRMTAHHHLDDRHHPGERHVVFPVGQARLDPEHDKVILASQRAEDAVNLPAYVPGEVSPDYEQGLRRWSTHPSPPPKSRTSTPTSSTTRTASTAIVEKRRSADARRAAAGRLQLFCKGASEWSTLFFLSYPFWGCNPLE